MPEYQFSFELSFHSNSTLCNLNICLALKHSAFKPIVIVTLCNLNKELKARNVLVEDVVIEHCVI